MTATTAGPVAATPTEQLIDALVAFDDDMLALMTPAELADYERSLLVASTRFAREHEDDWAGWLRLMFRSTFSAGFAPHHDVFWEWVWSIEAGVRPASAFVGVWNRGGAKSTSAETAVAALGARRRRRLALYICNKQHQADDHVANIATLLESPYLEMAYPELGQRALGKYGNVKGWRRNRLRTASGLTVEAMGLDTSARGIKVDNVRPDLIVFDDIDDENDGPAQIARKITDVTHKLLPTGDESCAVLVIQNLPNPQGVVARLAGVASEPAEFLRPRIVCGPIPALRDFTYERDQDGMYRIVHGEPTWEGYDLARCQADINEFGITAFLVEAQHEIDARGGGMFDRIEYRHCTRPEVPDLLRKCVWVDPAVTATDSSDSHGCICDGIAPDGRIFRLRAWERRATPVEALTLAIVWAGLEGVPRVGIETDQGGNTWSSVYKEALEQVREDLAALTRGDSVDGNDDYLEALVELAVMDPTDVTLPPFHEEQKAGSSQLSKAARAQQMLADYERPNRIVHVLGTHLVLERGLSRFPRTKPFDIVDAAYWSWRDLRRGGPARSSGKRAARTSLPAPTLIGAR